MVRNYLKNDVATHEKAEKVPAGAAFPSPTGEANLLRELQRRYAKTLAACYILFGDGNRCRFEDDPDKAFDCSHCAHNAADRFCKANLHLKKIIGLVAEYLAQKATASQASPSDEDKEIRCGWTAESVESFKAKSMSYEIETPLCEEHIWLVPEKTGKDRIEFTPEEMAFFLQAMDAVEGKIIEIGKKRREADTERAAEEDRA